MTKSRRPLTLARAVECFASGLCLTLVAASVLMAVEAQATPAPASVSAAIVAR